MDKFLKSITALLLALLMVLTCVPLGALAQENTQTDEEIYYSDIIFAYSTYIAENYYLNYYLSENEDCFTKIKEDFMDSPEYILMSVKEGMQSLNLRDYFRAASDALGNTEYTYEAALDKANIAFAQKMLKIDGNAYGTAATLNEWAKNFEKIAKVYDKIGEHYKTTHDNNSLITIFVSVLNEEGFLKFLSTDELKKFEDGLIEICPKIMKYTSVANNFLKFAKTVMSFIVVEEMRFGMIDDILSATSSGAVYDGMTRLKGQLQLGFVSYFISTYLKETIFDQVTKYVEDIVLNNILGNYGTAFSIVSALSDVSSLVIFDFLLDVADLDELTAQMVLAQYSKEFGQMVLEKSKVFSDYSFRYKDVTIFENLFLALGASTDAAYESCEPLLYNNESIFHYYQGRYYDCGIFNKAIIAIKDDLLELPKSERIRTNAEDFYFRNESILKSTPSDIIEENTFYCVDGYFNSNVNVPGSLTIPEGEIVEIRGYLKSYDGGSINLDGALTVTGDLELKAGYSAASYSHLNINNEVSLLVLEDDFICENYSCCNINAGTICFAGFENVQTVKGLSSYNITVTNPNGIKYYNDIKIKGHYNLNGYALEDNGYSTYIAANTASFDTVSDFKNVYTACNYELKDDLTANIYVQNYNFTIPYDADIILNGNVNVSNYRSVIIDGKAFVTGDMYFDAWYGSGEYGRLVMSREDSVLKIGGDIFFEDRNGSQTSKGTIIFAGEEAQTVNGLSPYNVTVTNPNGIILGSDLHLKGHFDLNGNPIEIGNCMTYVASNTASFDADSHFKKISLLCYYDLPCDVMADIYINNYGITIPENADVTVTGNIYVSDYGQLEVDGILTLTGNLETDSSYGGSMYGDFIMDKGNAIFAIGGDLYFDSSNSSQITDGTVIFCGSTAQTVTGLKPHNITVTNPNGIILGSGLYISGHFDANGNPIDNSNGGIIVSANTASFDTQSDFKSVALNCNYELTSNIKANIYVQNYNLTIPENADVIVDGNIDVSNYKTVTVNEKLYVTGDMTFDAWYGSGEYGRLSMTDKDAILRLGGDFLPESSKTCTITDGKVILCGDSLQNISALNADKLILENTSDDGVALNGCEISTLFNHNGNKFTASYCTFKDYDGDGIKDNLDEFPTVGLPCTITANVNDELFGNVSETEFDTIGGTEHTVTATPDSKYEFVKWIDADGNTVSHDAEFTFVAKTDETYTAVFSKRTQPITVICDGGVITAPTTAPIESVVDVTITENEGYIYNEGSLSYNGISIENYSFTMPDEAVTITAKFEYNSNYFALKEKIEEAQSITYEDYSKDSFSNLQTTIINAKAVLENHICEDTAQSHISNLQSAIDNLAEKYVVSVSALQVSDFYVGITDITENLLVNLYYDNDTEGIAQNFTVENFDAYEIGTQTILVRYGEFTASVTIDVVARDIINVTTYSKIPDQVYVGASTLCTPEISIYCNLTGEYLTEGVDYEVRYINNTKIGTARAIVSGIGYYEGAFVTEFNIYCEHNYETVEYNAPSCTENGDKTEVCSICADTKYHTNEIVKVFTKNLPESGHNYANNADVSYQFESSGASYLDLLFSSNTATEKNYDFIYIYDASGTLINRYSGTDLAGVNLRVTGDTVTIRLTSDGSYVTYGFSLDSITAFHKNPDYEALGHNFVDGKCENCENFEFDYNNDNDLDILDLITLKKFLLLEDLADFYDFNDDDGIIDAFDLIKLKKRLFEVY